MCASIRLPIRRLLLCLALLGALYLCWWAGARNTPASSVLNGAALQNQLTLLSAYGWEVDPEPTCETITLPEEFPPGYDSYLALQAECGYDLAPYAGATVSRYTYPVRNYPGWESGIYADLLVLDGTVIGGDIRSSQLDGFMQSLWYPD